MNRRIFELFGMLLIGDGVASVLEPRRHCMLWEVGPEPMRRLVDEFAQRPGMTRAVGLLEAAFGAWLASRQQPALLRVR